jgi:hypothetical protein
MYKFISYSRIMSYIILLKKVTKKLLYRSDGILQAVKQLQSNQAHLSSPYMWW